MKAWTFRNGSFKTWFVASLPEKGSDWGYSSKKEDAIQISEYWWKRFASDQNFVGQQAYCEGGQ